MTQPPADIAVTDGDLLAPEPAKLTGALIGYARVSTSGQILDRQVRALTEAGCIRVFADKLSGKTADRPELGACLDYLRAGDTLVVPSLDRLSRSLQDLITIVAGLRRRGTGFRSLHEALDTTTPGGRLVFHVFAALAEFIRELIVEGTREGLDAARARGQRLGLPPAMTAEQIRQARDLLTLPAITRLRPRRGDPRPGRRGPRASGPRGQPQVRSRQRTLLVRCLVRCFMRGPLWGTG